MYARHTGNLCKFKKRAIRNWYKFTSGYYINYVNDVNDNDPVFD